MVERTRDAGDACQTRQGRHHIISVQVFMCGWKTSLFHFANGLKVSKPRSCRQRLDVDARNDVGLTTELARITSAAVCLRP